MDRKYDVITLGEILLRLSTPINGRLAQGDTFMKHLGGAELNIASEIGQLGLNTAIISKIPTNLLAAFIKNQLNASRVSENYLIEDHSDDSRIGIYYYEYGSYPRKPRVVYDRKHSSINNIEISDVPQTLFYNTRLFHTSGITLGLGGKAQDFAIHCIKEFKKQGTLISFDLNYRNKLWSKEKAGQVMGELCKYVDVCISNEEDANDVFGIKSEGTEVTAGELNKAGYKEVAQKLTDRFGFKKVAITLRTSISANDNKWAAMLYENGESYFSKEYLMHIVDRVGGGDSFGGGLIYACLNDYAPQDTIEFAVAASCLKHSIEGDFNQVSVSEVQKLAGGDASGRVQR